MTAPENPPHDLPQQRAELAETVDALRAKLDVPTRGKAAVKTQAARLQSDTALRNGLIAITVAATVLTIVGRVRARRHL